MMTGGGGKQAATLPRIRFGLHPTRFDFGGGSSRGVLDFGGPFAIGVGSAFFLGGTIGSGGG